MGDQGSEIFRQLVDKVWPHDGILPWKDAREYRRIIEFLDRIPAHVQEIVGLTIMRYVRALIETGDQRSGSIYLDNDAVLQLMCNSTTNVADETAFLAEVAAVTSLRRMQVTESGGRSDLEALGVGILVDPTNGTLYTFVFVGEEIPLPLALRSDLERRYGLVNRVQGRVVSVEPRL